MKDQSLTHRWFAFCCLIWACLGSVFVLFYLSSTPTRPKGARSMVRRRCRLGGPTRLGCAAPAGRTRSLRSGVSPFNCEWTAGGVQQPERKARCGAKACAHPSRGEERPGTRRERAHPSPWWEPKEGGCLLALAAPSFKAKRNEATPEQKPVRDFQQLVVGIPYLKLGVGTVLCRRAKHYVGQLDSFWIVGSCTLFALRPRLAVVNLSPGAILMLLVVEDAVAGAALATRWQPGTNGNLLGDRWVHDFCIGVQLVAVHLGGFRIPEHPLLKRFADTYITAQYRPETDSAQIPGVKNEKDLGKRDKSVRDR